MLAVILLCAVPALGSAQAKPETAKPQAATPGTGANDAPPAPSENKPEGPQPQPDPKTATDQTPGLSVEVTLTDSFLGKRLPFDIPFYLAVTNTDTAVTDMSLNLYEVARRASVSALATELREARNCLSPTRRSLTTSTARRSPNNIFSLLIDDLQPQRYYIFCFVSRAPLDGKVIEDDVRKIIRDTAGALAVVLPNQQPPDVSLAMGTQIYASLQARIERLAAQQAVPAGIPRGNIFFPGTRVAQGSRFARALVPFMNVYRDLDFNSPRYRNYRGDRDAFFTAIDAALNDAALKTGAGVDLAQTVRGVLPARNLDLPDRNLAITSSEAVDLTPYDFERAQKVLGDAAVSAAALANGTDASNALKRASAALNLMAQGVSGHMSSFTALRNATQPLVDLVALESQRVTVSLGSTVLTADMNRNAYVSLDAGIAYPWRLENMVFYAGTNIYFRPINKEAPLRYKGTFLHRFAMTVGVTTTVKDDSRRASDLRPTQGNDDTSNSLLLGAGLRLTPSMRVGAGALIFKESDPNPLITQKSVTATPYVSFTADVNVAAIFKSFFPSNPE